MTVIEQGKLNTSNSETVSLGGLVFYSGPRNVLTGLPLMSKS